MLRGSNSGLFRAPGFIVSPLGKGEKKQKTKKGRKEKGIEQERKEHKKKELKRSEEGEVEGILTKIKTKNKRRQEEGIKK